MLCYFARLANKGLFVALGKQCRYTHIFLALEHSSQCYKYADIIIHADVHYTHRSCILPLVRIRTGIMDPGGTAVVLGSPL